ncbi:DUF4148 domain-containing protein [Caballeronia insecticola]|uniref:DUF4148 domain-containing protein n=1 Tax=Caballeronia insecticola TaxID=758793 RepID=R4WJY6_9BURK|nr:DUF4148 domain-containing protein [Caballeronia insecticola]BAN24729.1 putative uncharacterized protein [Caballeronia insecticola]
MKNTLIGGLLISALLATAPAFAQTSYGGKTRAEVKAELASARRAGDLDAVNALSYPQLRPYQERHAQLRGDLRDGGATR